MIFGVRRWPLLPTLVVLAAVAVMVRLGFWQLDRRAEEEAKLAQFADAASNNRPVAFPAAVGDEAAFYRRSNVTCAVPGKWRGTAGSSANGASGYVQIAQCQTPQGQVVNVQAGWSRDLEPPQWGGGPVSGIIAPNRDGTSLLVADPPVAGMEPSALPKPSEDQPAKNLSYAAQWFAFALTALVIYVLALRRKQGEAGK